MLCLWVSLVTSRNCANMLSRARASLLAGSQVVTKANGIVFLVCAAARNGKHKVRHRHIRLQTLNKWIQRFASTRKRLQGAGKLLTDSHKSLAMQLSNNCACVTLEARRWSFGIEGKQTIHHFLITSYEASLECGAWKAEPSSTRQ